jgi:hypothetical protein
MIILAWLGGDYWNKVPSTFHCLRAMMMTWDGVCLYLLLPQNMTWQGHSPFACHVGTWNALCCETSNDDYEEHELMRVCSGKGLPVETPHLKLPRLRVGANFAGLTAAVYLQNVHLVDL